MDPSLLTKAGLVLCTSEGSTSGMDVRGAVLGYTLQVGCLPLVQQCRCPLLISEEV